MTELLEVFAVAQRAAKEMSLQIDNYMIDRTYGKCDICNEMISLRDMTLVTNTPSIMEGEGNKKIMCQSIMFVCGECNEKYFTKEADECIDEEEEPISVYTAAAPKEEKE